MIKSRLFSQAELQNLVSSVEDEVAQAEAQRAEQQRMQQITAWVHDPRNKSIIDADPMVQKLRAMNPAPQRQPAPQPMRYTPAPVAATRYKSRQQLERERPWLAPRKPEVESVIDPYAGRKPNRI